MKPKDFVFKGQAKLDKTLGYMYYCDKSHPLSCVNGKVYAHRHEASVMLGEWLNPSLVVHHKDGDKANNSHENLEVMTPSDHTRLHQTIWPLIYRKCAICGIEHTNDTYCSQNCYRLARRKVKQRPSHKQLLEDLENSSYLAVGRKYGVSGNCIRKWIRGYNRVVSPRTSNPEKG